MEPRSIPLNEIQRALYELLSHGLVGIPVYDRIPGGKEQMPYIWLGDFFGEPVTDTKGMFLHRVRQVLDVWSDQPGKKEISRILGEIVYLTTHGRLPLQGYTQIGNTRIASYETMPEVYPNGTGAYHGRLVMEYMVTEEENR